MIGKAPATGSGFRGIVNYLVMGKLGRKEDRVAWSETRNLIVDEPELVPRIMRSTASRSTRCSEPVYHFAICWHKSEVPSRDIQAAIADATLEDLDLTEHQSLLIAHKDTEHHHLHIVVNRVHPETAKAWDRWKDWVRIEKSLGRQAKEHGLIYVPGRHNEPEKFREVPTKARNSEFRMAERLGSKHQLRLRWSKVQIAEKRAALVPTFEQVRNWGELERALAQQGLGLERKGRGIVIGDATGTMKLSDLGKQIRLGSLEGRFNESWDVYEKRRDEPVIDKAKAATSADDESSTAPLAKAQPVQRHQHEPAPVRSKSTVQNGGEEAAESNQAVPDMPGEGGAHAAIGSQLPRQDDKREDMAPRMDPKEFANLWKKRADDIEAKRADDERKKAAEAQAKEAAEGERRRREEQEETMRLLRAKFAAPAKPPEPARSPDVWRDETRPTPEPNAEAKARAAAHAAKANADAEADLAYKLHQAGLVSRKQLAHSVRERDNAQEEVDKHASGRAKLANDLRKALLPAKPIKDVSETRRRGPKPRDKSDRSRD